MKASPPKHVLVVDEDLLTRSTLSRYLRLKGYRVRQAASRHEALAVAGERRAPWYALVTTQDAVAGRARELLRELGRQRSSFHRSVILRRPVAPEALLVGLGHEQSPTRGGEADFGG